MTLSISQVSQATGLAPSALRYYEQVGLIRPVARHGGRRHYEPSVMTRLRLIALCQSVGMTIAEIGTLLDGRGGTRDRWRSLAEDKLVEIDRRIDELRAMRRHLTVALECGCGRIEDCDMVALQPQGAHLPLATRR